MITTPPLPPNIMATSHPEMRGQSFSILFRSCESLGMLLQVQGSALTVCGFSRIGGNLLGPAESCELLRVGDELTGVDTVDFRSKLSMAAQMAVLSSLDTAKGVCAVLHFFRPAFIAHIPSSALLTGQEGIPQERLKQGEGGGKAGGEEEGGNPSKRRRTATDKSGGGVAEASSSSSSSRPAAAAPPPLHPPPRLAGCSGWGTGMRVRPHTGQC